MNWEITGSITWGSDCSLTKASIFFLDTYHLDAHIALGLKDNPEICKMLNLDPPEYYLQTGNFRIGDYDTLKEAKEKAEEYKAEVLLKLDKFIEQYK